ncbi:MAG: restriction modification system DNA specificity subunit [Chloroflexi bacterium OLB14]|nr:MAG: restriction modification system DNA specificity subunit [Chloroflexi bacterium OLB14]
MPGLSREIAYFINVNPPDLATQKKISAVLSALDAKIELNTRINAELESLAKTLYDYWFVQFAPHKSAGGEMVWNEELKREIPLGWEVVKLGDCFEVKKGSLITEKTKENGLIKVVAGGLDFAYYHSEFNRDENTVTISGSGANAGFVNFWREKIFASDCTTVRGATDVETIIVYYYLKLMQKQIYRYSQGSAQPHVYPTDIKKSTIYLRPKKNL